jgi:hypothetical protein
LEFLCLGLFPQLPYAETLDVVVFSFSPIFPFRDPSNQ